MTTYPNFMARLRGTRGQGVARLAPRARGCFVMRAASGGRRARAGPARGLELRPHVRRRSAARHGVSLGPAARGERWAAVGGGGWPPLQGAPPSHVTARDDEPPPPTPQRTATGLPNYVTISQRTQSRLRGQRCL